MIRHIVVALSALLAFIPIVALAQSGQSAIARYESRFHPVYDTEGMVASQNAVASRIGAQVLADGGNAIDAAVAVGFALAVTLPRAGNIGGGGFLLAYIEEEQRTIAIDYREMAPPAATRDMYLDQNGDADPAKSRFGHQASAVPGTVAGLWLAHSEYGRLPWEQLLTPAIGLARDGILVSWDLSTNLRQRQERLSANDATRQYYYKPGGDAYEPGERLIQSDFFTSSSLPFQKYNSSRSQFTIRSDQSSPVTLRLVVLRHSSESISVSMSNKA
jgi:gamma-glutamyltranspeptidase/glutathione hydrolase